MFKRVVPVLSLVLLAGPVFAADTPPPADQSASAPAKSTTTKKHHSKKHHKTATSSDSSGRTSAAAPDGCSLPHQMQLTGLAEMLHAVAVRSRCRYD